MISYDSFMKTTILPLKHSMNLSPVRLAFPLILLAFVCFALAPMAWADCQEGCDLNQKNTFLGDNALIQNISGRFNTATGAGALSNNTTGFGNTAMGEDVLSINTTGSLNTATGVSALSNNTTGVQNTATGVDALESNTTGLNNTANGFKALQSDTTGGGNTAIGTEALSINTIGSNNTAIGNQALHSNATVSYSTAIGASALYSNTIGYSNTATGASALYFNTTGGSNTANGASALYRNTTGSGNTANGDEALADNTTGNHNTATGSFALLLNTTGINNTANGANALYNNTTGSRNIALGVLAGGNVTTGSNNIDIGSKGVLGDANTIRIGTNGLQTNTHIAGISGVTVAGGVGVIIDTDGQLGTATSSARFKEAIKPMDKASEAILALQPVTFRYKHDLDPDGTPQFGLVAEDVERVNPALVAHDEQGKPYTVRYEAVNAMLLNEFLKEHRNVQELKSTLAQQQKQIEALTAGLQKVSAQLELSKPVPQTVLNQ
jgi:trimeric autotransporter adhesin